MVLDVDNGQPIFPPEIERQIFEWVIQISPSFSVRMMLVAYRVHQWIAPFLYRIARQFFPPYLPDVEHGGPSLDYFSRYVKQLFIGGDSSVERIRQFLSSCNNLTDLALLTHYPIKQFLDILDKIKLQKIMLNMTSLTAEDIRGSAAFLHITHLDITAFGEDMDRWKALTYLPHLTHIAINEPTDHKVFRYLLQHCTLLRILLAVQSRRFSPTMACGGTDPDLEIYDPRFVMLLYTRFTVQDWENGINGCAQNIWTCAEVISSAKHRGILPRARFCTWFTEYIWRAELEDLRLEIPYTEEQMNETERKTR